MSKDIWHSALEIPVFDDTVVFIDDLNNWHTGYTQRDNDGITDHDSGKIYTEENVLRWAYIKDLLAHETENKDLSDKIGKLETELDRTRKALDVAIQYIKHTQIVEPFWFNSLANKTLDEIKTALEQKESAFVHNKIEFPEYNDNLLEEFDKQFFENGQHDDLTETALEQKDVK